MPRKFVEVRCCEEEQAPARGAEAETCVQWSSLYMHESRSGIRSMWVPMAGRQRHSPQRCSGAAAQQVASKHTHIWLQETGGITEPTSSFEVDATAFGSRIAVVCWIRVRGTLQSTLLCVPASCERSGASSVRRAYLASCDCPTSCTFSSVILYPALSIQRLVWEQSAHKRRRKKR